MKGRTERQVRHWFYILILAPVAMGKEDLSKAKGPPGRERAEGRARAFRNTGTVQTRSTRNTRLGLGKLQTRDQRENGMMQLVTTSTHQAARTKVTVGQMPPLHWSKRFQQKSKEMKTLPFLCCRVSWRILRGQSRFGFHSPLVGDGEGASSLSASNGKGR